MLTLGADLFPESEYDQTWVLTRLHARYDKDDVAEDLVFKAAAPIAGGRERVVDYETMRLEEGARASNVNGFQGRYIIRNPWTGDVECENPYLFGWYATSQADQSPNTKGSAVVLDASRDIENDIIGSVGELGIEGRGTRPQGTVGSNTPNNTNNAGSPNNGVTSQPDDLDGGGCSATGLGTVPFAFGLLLLGWRRRK